jgi:hypothetical protein
MVYPLDDRFHIAPKHHRVALVFPSIVQNSHPKINLTHLRRGNVWPRQRELRALVRALRADAKRLVELT